MIDKNERGARETEYKKYFGTENVFLVSSGKAALFLILSALKSLRDKTKVIIPAYTCYYVPSAVIKAGLKVVPCDIRPETLDYDFDKLKTLSDDDTLCIIPTHLFGIPSDVDRIRDICENKGIFILEDAAQAMGVTIGERKVGTLGDVGFFSLGRGKNITCGSGGIIVAYSQNIAEVLRNLCTSLRSEPFREYMANIISVALMSVFINPYLYWLPHGLPFLKIGETKFYKDFPVFRLSGFKAGLLRHWRKSLDSYNSIRSEFGEYYLRELNLKETLPIYSFPFPYLRFPIYVNNNDLKGAYYFYRFFGITRMYPDSVNNIKEIMDQFIGYDCRNAEYIANTLLTLPSHSVIKDQDRMNIIKIAKNIMTRRSAIK